MEVVTDVELRDIEIFLTLAEELHFGRTAERLHVTTARVSQSIKMQERRVGGPLFERTTRTVRLTPLGEQLHRQLSVGYRQITHAIQGVAAAARGMSGRLTLGAMGAQPWTITAVLKLLQARHPAIELRIREIQPTAPLEELRAGDVDAVLVWLPIREPDLTVGPVVHTSQVMLAVNSTHPFAARDSVCVEDLRHCTVITCPALPPSMEEVFNPFRTPSGHPIARGPVASSWHEVMSIVASGQAVSGVASEAVHFYAWPNMVYLPIRDAPPCQWVFAWRTLSETPLIRALAQAAADTPTAGNHKTHPFTRPPEQ